MRLTTAFAILAAALLVGCSSNQESRPLAHQVEGKVVHADGKPYTKGGSITFRHESAVGTSTQGTIENDGRFTLNTVSPNHNVKGALEGPHTVIIMPNSPDQSAVPIRLKKKYDIAAGDNSLTVDVDN